MKKFLNRKIFINTFAFVLIVIPFFVSADNTSGSRFVTCDGPNCEFSHLKTLIIEVIKFLVELGIALSAVVFAYAGWLYMTSGGDEGKVKQAHDLFVRVLWGFLIMLGATLIVGLILTALGVNITTISL